MARGTRLRLDSGQIKLAVYINYGLLTIHVVEGRHLSCKEHGICNTYLKFALAPDSSKRTRCKTNIVPSTNNPVFNEKFSFELLERDLRKRLLVSAWSHDKRRGDIMIHCEACNELQPRMSPESSLVKSEFLGCMSFGISNIQCSHKKVDGWYYLLSEDMGRRKHLQVASRRTSYSDVARMSEMMSLNNTEPLWLDSYTICLHRQQNGYGFSVTGASPVQVSRVDAGSSAASAGLQKSDYIVRIDGQNVTRATSNTVARIIKHSQHQVILEVQRSCPSQPSLIPTVRQESTWKENIRPPRNTSTPFNKTSKRSFGCSMQTDNENSLTMSTPPLRLEDLMTVDEEMPSASSQEQSFYLII